MSRRWSTILVATGLALLLGSPLAWWQLQPDATIGAVPTSQADAGHTPTSAIRERAGRSPATSPAGTSGPHVSATRPDSAEAAPGLTPIHLELPSLGVEAAVDPVGLDVDGGMDLPDDVSRVGWYAPGVAVGEQGTAVLAGHVDSRVQGPGALFDLRRLEPGEAIVVGDGDDTSRWRVTGRTRYPKDELPIAEIFRWDGDPGLVLITCGGDFVAADGHYRDNVVVFAEPA